MGENRCRVSYSLCFWALFIITTIPFIVDRFTTNIWPRQWFATEGHGTGTDRIGFKEGPPTVIAYQAIARLSGRYTMAALNALWFTMMHTTHNFLADSWVGRYLIDFTDDTARIQIHRYIGISICVVTLLHVWSILFPVMFSGFNVKVVLGYFSWPLSEQAPKGFQDVNSTTTTMMMQGDDVYRLILMTFMLGPVIYLSVRWMCSNYRRGIRLHQFIMLMYFVDIVRRHTHPHSWVFNTPMLFIWLFDCIWGHYYAHQRTSVDRVMISPDYMLILWKSKLNKKNFISSIGDVFNMRSAIKKADCYCGYVCCGEWERSHPFTTFFKRNAKMADMKLLSDPLNNKLITTLSEKQAVEVISSADCGVNNSSTGDEWDRAVVVRTYCGESSQTRVMREKKQLCLDIWGRFLSGDIAKYINSEDDVVLIGGGSGSGYLIDTLFYLSENSRYLDEEANSQNFDQDMCDNSSVGIIFTSNDLNLVQWFTNITDNILLNNDMPLSKRLSITIALTNGNGATHGVTSLHAKDISWGKVILGRCNMEEEIKAMTSEGDRMGHVYCQGGESLQNAARKAASDTKKRYHEGHSFDNGKPKNKKGCCCTPVEKILPV